MIDIPSFLALLDLSTMGSHQLCSESENIPQCIGTRWRPLSPWTQVLLPQAYYGQLSNVYYTDTIHKYYVEWTIFITYKFIVRVITKEKQNIRNNLIKFLIALSTNSPNLEFWQLITTNIQSKHSY